jgi:DNA-binding XRE family transcriptional regulator
MTTAEDHDLIELQRLTDSWKACLGEYQGAMAFGSLDQAREAESERRKLFAELRSAVDRLRAKHPEDASLRAAWEQLYQAHGFLQFGTAAGITPYLEKLVLRPLADWQPLVGGALDKINPRAVHNDWTTQGWPKRLLRARQSQGITQKEAAYACGVAEQTYERWERGEQPPATSNTPKVLAFIQSAEEKAGSGLVHTRPQ